MKKRRKISHKEYQSNQLSQMKKKINEELEHDLMIQNVSPIIHALADSHGFEKGVAE